MQNEDIANFAASLRGRVIGAADPDYDEARKLYNGMIDKRPMLIARCADVADVITAVNFAREANLPLAIRGGGHNGPGLGSVDDGRERNKHHGQDRKRKQRGHCRSSLKLEIASSTPFNLNPP